MSIEVLQSWGVASARHSSGCTVQFPPSPTSNSTPTISSSPAPCQGGGSTEHLYDIPLGPSVIRWDVSSKKRLMQFQAHPDLITCLSKSPDGSMMSTSSHSGVLKLWTSDWKCLDMTNAPMKSQFHVS